MVAAMPCKMRTKKRLMLRETASESDESNKILKTQHTCNVEAQESTRNRLESFIAKDHEDHIAEKGFNSINHYTLVHKFVPMPQAMKILDAKPIVDKELEKLEKLPAWQFRSRVRRRSFWKHKESPLCYIDGRLSPQEYGVRT